MPRPNALHHVKAHVGSYMGNCLHGPMSAAVKGHDHLARARRTTDSDALVGRRARNGAQGKVGDRSAGLDQVCPPSWLM